MNAKQRRQEFRRYERLYERVRIDYRRTLQAIMDNLERYPKSMVMVQIQHLIDEASVPFRKALHDQH